jgi:hypothetical protein
LEPKLFTVVNMVKGVVWWLEVALLSMAVLLGSIIPHLMESSHAHQPQNLTENSIFINAPAPLIKELPGQLPPIGEQVTH